MISAPTHQAWQSTVFAATVVLALALPLATGARGQAAASSFDVVSIKRNVSGSQDVTVSIGVQGNEESVVKHLSIILNISPANARQRVNANVEIEASLRFVNGKRVTKEAKKEVAAGNTNG